MNKKGFTLVELLAIIVVLAVIITITATSGFGLFKSAKDKINSENIKVIKKGVALLLSEVEVCDEDLDEELIETFTSSGKTCEDLKNYFNSANVTIYLSYLIENEYISGTSIEKISQDNPYAEIVLKNGKYDSIKNLNLDNNTSTEEGNQQENTTTAVTKLLKDKILSNGVLADYYNESNVQETPKQINTIQTLSLPITTIADNADKSGLFKVQDNNGTSYVYRGTVTNNYIKFAGLIWRIVRINGDGTIRLILNDAIETTYFNSDAEDNAYVGYMYGLTGVTTDINRCLKLDENNDVIDVIELYNNESNCKNNGGIWTTTAYEATHANVKSSIIKNKVDSFYETKLKSYSKNIADTTFCGDKSVSVAGTGINTINTSYSAGVNIRTKQTLKCNGKYSSYNLSNGLKYPIGLLSAEEFVIAGGLNEQNPRFYLTINNQWWLLTPYRYDDPDNANKNTNIFVSETGIIRYSRYNKNRYIRPVINLKSDTLINTGNGTKNSPYTIQ